MNGLMKIGAGVVARIIDFAFSGYGLVCDVVFLKLILRHISYRYLSCLQLCSESRFAEAANASLQKVKEHLSDLLQSGNEHRNAYYRHR
jgi:hypothetical protein